MREGWGEFTKTKSCFLFSSSRLRIFFATATKQLAVSDHTGYRIQREIITTLLPTIVSDRISGTTKSGNCPESYLEDASVPRKHAFRAKLNVRLQGISIFIFILDFILFVAVGGKGGQKCVFFEP